MKYCLLLMATISSSAICAQWKGFSAFTGYPVQKSAYLLHTKDITGDGIADITALPAAADEQFSILAGRGDGTFHPEKTIYKPTNYSLSDIADFNKDGYPELVVSSYWDNGFRIFHGSPGNNFSQSTYYATGVHGRAVKCTDINKDGHIDIVAVTSGSGRTISLHVFINKGDGSFYPVKSFLSVLDTSQDIFITDKNNDGLPDIMVSSTFFWVVFFLQTPDGNFEPHYWPTLAHARVAVNDTDRDGKDDLVLLYTSFDNDPGADSLVIKRNIGDSSFGASVVIPQLRNKGVRPYHIRMMDLDHDGYADILVNHTDREGYATDTLYYMLATGVNTFNEPVALQVPAKVVTMELGDVDADGYVDLIVSGDNNKVYVAMNNRSAPEQPVTGIRVYPNPTRGSFYIDGLHNGPYTLQVYSNNGSLLQTTTLISNKQQRQPMHHAAGLYYLVITDKDKKSVVKTVVIQ